MSGRKTILILGIDPAGSKPVAMPEHVKQVAADPVGLKQRVEEQMKKISEAGYDLEVKQLKPDDFDSGLVWLKEKLASQHWDGFVVGGGIRQTPVFTEFFEQCVNASREVSPSTKLLFNTAPTDLYETCCRL